MNSAGWIPRRLEDRMRDERWQLTYINKAGAERSCYPRSKEKRDANIEICKQRGYKVVRCVKLYPFSSEKNQHIDELDDAFS